MLSQVRGLVWIAAVGALLGQVRPISAQGRTALAPARTNFINPARDETPVEKLPDLFSCVSFIDSALPRNTVRLRFDNVQRFKRPTLAEYLQPKGGLPGTPGPPLPETNVDYMDLSTYLEYAPDTWFSVFVETPFRWVNPDLNQNTSGEGDMNLGFKMGIFTEERFFTAFQLRAFLPTARNSALGTRHVSLEPAILASFRIADRFQLEGEVRYWTSLGGTDFAGDILRYGLGLSYGHPGGNVIWLSPVVEVVGWTIQSGKALAVGPGGFLGIEDASGQTIINAQAGLRIGLGHSADIYAGYSRAITGPTWYRDLMRIEFRLLY